MWAIFLTCPRGESSNRLYNLAYKWLSFKMLFTFILLPAPPPPHCCRAMYVNPWPFRGDGLPTPWYCTCALASGTLALVPHSTTNFTRCVSLRQEVIICKIWPVIRNFLVLLLQLNRDGVCRAFSTRLGTHWALGISCGYSFCIILLISL